MIIVAEDGIFKTQYLWQIWFSTQFFFILLSFYNNFNSCYLNTLKLHLVFVAFIVAWNTYITMYVCMIVVDDDMCFLLH